jgi:hypothetical protein
MISLRVLVLNLILHAGSRAVYFLPYCCTCCCILPHPRNAPGPAGKAHTLDCFASPAHSQRRSPVIARPPGAFLGRVMRETALGPPSGDKTMRCMVTNASVGLVGVPQASTDERITETHRVCRTPTVCHAPTRKPEAGRGGL